MKQDDDGHWKLTFRSFAGTPELSSGMMPFAELQAKGEATYVDKAYPALLNLVRTEGVKNADELGAAIKMLMQQAAQKHMRQR